MSSTRNRGFTLLEVMCAFAILAGLTGALTVIYFHAVQQGRRALERRELREAADTVFRQLIYEEHKWHDGDSKTMDQTYADWANLKGAERDRWRAYRWELKKERKTAAGKPDPAHDEEALFAPHDDTDGRTTSTDTTKDDEPGGGLALWRMTMTVTATEGGDHAPLMILRTFIPVRDDAATKAAAGTPPK